MTISPRTDSMQFDDGKQTELVAVVMANGTVDLEWSPADSQVSLDKQRLQQQIYHRFQKGTAAAFLFLGFCREKISLSPSLEFWRNFSQLFTKQLIQTPDLEKTRDKVHILLSEQEIEQILQRSPFMIGVQYLHADVLNSLWADLNRQLQKEIKQHDGSVESLIKSYSPDVQILGRIYFHLVENKNSDKFPFAFLATYSTSFSQQGNFKHIPLKFAVQEYADSDEKLLGLLTTVDTAAQKSEFIAELLDSGEIFHPLAWTTTEAFTFLQEIPIYEQAGILCRIPNWWKAASNSIKVHISVGDTKPKYLGMDALLQFDARLLLGDQEITVEEARKILEEAEGLACIKGKWIEVNAERLRQVLATFERAQQAIAEESLNLRDAMHMQLGIDPLGIADDEDLVEISSGEWLQQVTHKLRNPESLDNFAIADEFNAVLRPYQQQGVNWLNLLHSLQLGACLADDMGLGKTVQILAFISGLKQRGSNSASLLVIPASLLANWQNEIERFAPQLQYFIAHPGFTPKIQHTNKTGTFLDSCDLIITTYALIQKYDWLAAHQWNYVILDEAQAVKNPGTKQTRAVKKLLSYNRIILTGTPIENKLGDLWSLYDFVNPGLLGNSREFKQFTKDLNDDNRGYARLKQVISPYILRRLKTDTAVITDLPDKIEMKVYAELSKKQILLYKKLVADIEKAMQEIEGPQRSGLILSSLLKFKQICNHPGQYLGNGEFLEKDSGKFLRLKEICQTILAKREKVLVFTQFKEITTALHDYLQMVFGRAGLILHGSVAVKKRKQLIDRFQSEEYVPYFVISVKAGGVGLNLTEANHVIHFDRWWNPAVENQATDRAFRIGQTKKVVVHKFITQGTIEEKIDSMLEDKLSLSQQIIHSTGEKWIMQMNNEEILDLFKLSL